MFRHTDDGWVYIKKDGTRIYIVGVVIFGLMVAAALLLIGNIIRCSLGG